MRLALSVPSILALLAAGCGASIHIAAPSATRTDTLSLETGAESPLRVDVRAGSVSLETAPGTTLGVVAEVRAPSEEDLRRVEVFAVRAADGGADVGYRVSGSAKGISVSFRIAAPAAAPLRVKTGAGSVSVRGFGAGLDAESGAGSLDIRDVRGDLLLRSGAGDIDVRDADGVVTARTGAGHVDVTGRLRGANVLETDAGDVRVTLPAESALRVEGGTGAGDIGTGFPSLRVAGGPARRTVAGVLGSGDGGALRLNTGAGSIEILSRVR